MKFDKKTAAALIGVAVAIATALGYYVPSPAPDAPAKCVPCACDSPADAGAP